MLEGPSMEMEAGTEAFCVKAILADPDECVACM